jgi:hypothetical protein
MIGHVSAGPLRVCVSVVICYNPSFVDILTYVKMIEMCVESDFATICI